MNRTFEILRTDRTIEIPDEAVQHLYAYMNPDNVAKNAILDSLRLCMTHNAGYWASVCLDRSYRLCGHIAEVRPNRSDIRISNFTYYTDGYITEVNPPPAGIIHFASKAMAKSVADKSPLFAAAWEALMDLDEQKHWICFCGPIPKDWATVMEAKDNETVREVINLHKSWALRLYHDDKIWLKFRKAQANGDLADALRLGITMLEKQPLSARAALSVGLACQELGMSDQALGGYQRAVANWKRTKDENCIFHDKLNYPGMEGQRKEQREKHERHKFKEMLSAVWALEREGDVYLERGSRDNAISVWQQAIAIYPAGGAAPKLAQCYLASGELEKAKALCLNISIRDPEDCNNWMMLGAIFAKTKSYREACNAYNKAYQLDLSSPEANYYLGATLIQYAYAERTEPFKDGQLKFNFEANPLYDRGLFHIKAAIRNASPPSFAWYMLGMGYFGIRQYAQASEAFREYVRQESDNIAGLNNLALSEAMCSNYESAINATAKALSLTTDDPPSWDTLGFIELRRGNIQKALDSLNKAVQLDPKNVEAYCNLAEAYASAGEPERARDNYRIARYLAPVRTWQWALDNPDLADSISILKGTT